MKNFEKYKTSEERVLAFHEFLNKRCGKGICEKFEVRDLCNELGYDGKFVGWLILEADDEKPEPCPFCGSDCKEDDSGEFYFVRCVDHDCYYCSGNALTIEEAISKHNRVASAVRNAKRSK